MHDDFVVCFINMMLLSRLLVVVMISIPENIKILMYLFISILNYLDITILKMTVTIHMYLDVAILPDILETTLLPRLLRCKI